MESIGSTGSSIDDMKDQQELLEKVGKLKGKLKQAEIDLSAQKTLRKKKEKSMVKLAKELTKRSKDQTEKEREINALKVKVANLEASLSAAQNEIEARVAANKKKLDEHNNDLNEAQQKYRKAVAEADARIAQMNEKHTAEAADLRRQARDATIELERLRTHLMDTKKAVKNSDTTATKAASIHEKRVNELQKKEKKISEEYEDRISMLIKKHTEQTDEMRKKIFETNLECDNLKSKLTSMQMKDSPGDVQGIKQRALASLYEPAKKASWLNFVSISLALLMVAIAIGAQMELWSMDAVCSPAMPGTKLNSKDVTLSAPWWAPGDFKADVFGYVCSNRQRLTLYWTSGLLLIKDTNSKIVVEKRANSGLVKANYIHSMNRKGKIESIRAPWTELLSSSK